MLRGLSEKGKALYGYLISLAQQGYSANKALEALRELGLGYRRTDFLADWRIITAAAEKSEKLKYVPRHAVISDRLYVPAQTSYPEKYMTTVRVVFTDQWGFTHERYVTVRHDTLLTRAEIEKRALDMIIGSADLYNQDPSAIYVHEIMPVKGLKRWEW